MGRFGPPTLLFYIIEFKVFLSWKEAFAAPLFLLVIKLMT